MISRETLRSWRQRFWRVAGSVSIRTKILGIVLAMVIVPGTVITYQIRSTLIRTLRDQLQQQSISIARDVAARSTDLVLVNDLYALSRLLKDTQRYNPDVQYIFVLDTQGNVLAHTFGAGFPADLLTVNPLPAGSPYHVQPLLSEEGLIWDTVVPIFEGRAGIVRVGLDEHRMWQTINTITGQIVLSLLGVSVFGIGAAYALTWLLTRPLLALVAATERVGRGDYSPRVQRWADDELGDLAEAFNIMVQQLAQAEAERAERERLRQFYLKRVIHAQEEERKRIARELHDETGQALASLMVGLRNTEEVNDPEEMRQRLQDLRQVLAVTLDRLRRLAFDLRPSILDDLGLVAALRRYVQQYQERFGITVELQVVGLENQRLPPEVETTIYRIVQEALTNAAKYAECAYISVLLQARSDHLSVIVEDDGCGFDAAKVFSQEAGRSKLGLYGMKERAELIGGHLDIESQPGSGTAIYLRVPLPAPAGPARTNGAISNSSGGERDDARAHAHPHPAGR